MGKKFITGCFFDIVIKFETLVTPLYPSEESLHLACIWKVPDEFIWITGCVVFAPDVIDATGVFNVLEFIILYVILCNGELLDIIAG